MGNIITCGTQFKDRTPQHCIAHKRGLFEALCIPVNIMNEIIIIINPSVAPRPSVGLKAKGDHTNVHCTHHA